jgi:hypothetical protein
MHDVDVPVRRFGRGEAFFHMLLPVASLLFGVPLLVGWVSYYSDGVREPELTFLTGCVFTVLGGLELIIWRRRLRARARVEDQVKYR